MTLHYPFPHIEHIDDVLPHLDDCFRVVEKEGLTFINYNMMGNDTFPPVVHGLGNRLADRAALRAAVRRECRGIVFDTATGKIVSRPFHKFFNAGEREDVALDLIDVGRPHIIVEKLDGSMIRPLPTPFGIRWGTKMGFTDVGMLAEEFVADKGKYLTYARHMMDCGFTPLFEFCSRRSRIVVDYPEETMVLLAVRDNNTGAYLPRWEVRSFAGLLGIPVVENVDVLGREKAPDDDEFIEGVHTLDTVIDGVRNQTEGEGKILLFADGHAVKIKADWYVRVHRAKDMMRSERRLVDLILNEEVDDLIAVLDGSDKLRVFQFMDTFNCTCRWRGEKLAVAYAHARERYHDRKSFALSPFAEQLPKSVRSMIFKLWDGTGVSTHEVFMDGVKRGMSSETKFAEMKLELGLDTRWNEIWRGTMEEAA